MQSQKTSHPQTSALQGLKVLELGQLIAGPFAAKTLADFGAEVIKIEPPGGGDPLRKWRMLKDGTSVWWQVQSRNKRSLALDLRTPEGQALVNKLANEADILIENFRPGALEGWGLSPERLIEQNPKLIVLRISGYGQTGPYRNLQGQIVLSARKSKPSEIELLFYRSDESIYRHEFCQSDQRDGRRVDLDEKGRRTAEGPIRKGLPEGDWLFYSADGKLKAETRMLAGQMTGPQVLFGDDGKTRA
jgi:hypothetical protein